MSEDGRPPVEIVRRDDEHAWVALVDGAEAGRLVWQDRDGTVVLAHTEVDPAHEGAGIGSALARAALDDLRDQGTPTAVTCPFVSAFVERHPEYASA